MTPDNFTQSNTESQVAAAVNAAYQEVAARRMRKLAARLVGDTHPALVAGVADALDHVLSGEVR